MIIYPPEIKRSANDLRLAVRLEYESAFGKTLPKFLWLDMPPEQEQYLSSRMDGWVTALFLVAMRCGEPLTVKGTLSDKLAHGIQEYQRAVSSWYPEVVRMVPVRAAGYDCAPPPLTNGVGLTFSGGVDSFFSLRSHMAPREPSPAYQITHGIFLQGVDIAYSEEATMLACREAYGEMFASFGMQMLTLRTNIRDLFPGVEWGGWMGYPFLDSMGMLFGKLFRRFYVASSDTYWDRLYGGKLLFLDPFLSTEFLQIIHDGAGWGRADKIAQIADWAPVQHSLRVCYTAPNGLNNCCRCPKCMHAMLCLDLAGQLDHMQTFPLGYTRQQFRTTPFGFRLVGILNDTRKRALRLGRRDLAFDVSCGMARAVLVGGTEIAARRVKRRLQRENKIGSVP